MTSLPYVLIVLFALGDGSVMIMQTSQSFASPLTCSMRAFLETDSARKRTYVCVTRDRAAVLAGGGGPLAAHDDPADAKIGAAPPR